MKHVLLWCVFNIALSYGQLFTATVEDIEINVLATLDSIIFSNKSACTSQPLVAPVEMGDELKV